MRDLAFATAIALGLELACSAVGRASESIPNTANVNLPFPEQISLMQDRLGWTYYQADSGLPLYMSTADSPGESMCNDMCARTWIPLVAPASAKPLGEWTIIVRKDRSRQWAFKSRPVYTYVDDAPAKPTGDGANGIWHVMPHFH
jgi:predicted lipoprotein with Yx(FWY)xxD motif